MDAPELVSDQRLQELGKALASEFRDAKPFPHVVIDGLFNVDVLRQVANEFPETGWYEFENSLEIKRAIQDETKMGPVTRSVIQQLNGQAVVKFLEDLSAISGLVPDPNLEGGGLHQIRRGGLLKIHADFNEHPKLHLSRRLNLLLYLNEDWDEAWGGHLELWDKDMVACEKKVLPIIGRCVVFATTDSSPHGHSDPLTCPEDRSRRSIAMYYYTNGRPKSEVGKSHSTIFYARPGETLAKQSRLRQLAGLAVKKVSNR